MLQWVPSDQGNPAGAGSAADFNIPANQGIAAFLFCPTARQIDADGTAKDEPQARTKQTIFARGYKEVTTLRIAGGVPYRWRRICFRCKGGPELWIANSASGTFSQPFYRMYTSFGYVRIAVSLPVAFQTIIEADLFRGVQNQDWSSPFNAKVDTSTFDVVSDRTITLNPGNSVGHTRTVKQWYPMNKNLTYTDDEAGVTVDTNEFSVPGKQGMGDFFIFDIMQSTTSAQEAGLLFNHEGTFYWHER